MTIKEKENQIVEDFELFDDWMDKYNHLIEMGKSLPIIEAKHKTENNLITGCQSRVWLHATMEDDRVVFTADSDAVITKGIINILVQTFSGEKPEDIVTADMAFIEQIGLKEHLSPTRSNGLVSMIKQVKLYAMAFQAKSK